MEHIGEILAKSQPAHSPTSTQIERTCPCGEHFTTTTWTKADGTKIDGYEKCQKCRQLDRIEQEKQEADKQLKETIAHQEFKWVEDSHLPEKFNSKTFDNFDAKLQPKAYKAVKDLQWQWNNTAEVPPKSLVLLSPGVYGVEIGRAHV